VRAGNPPLSYWLLEPLTDRPFQPVAWGWLAFLTTVALLGFWASLAACGWRRRFVPVVIFLLLPPVLIGNAYGNVHALAFTALALVLLFIRRYPYLAGVCGTIGWLKPQLVFPLILLLALSQRRVAGRFVVGFAGATALLALATIAAVGAHSFLWWMHGLTDWSNVIGLEPNIASLAGLYTGWASPGLRAMLQVLFLAFALALTAWWWWPRRQLAEIPIQDGAWLWGVWFLATPFAHYPDLVLLTIPVLASLGGDASRLTTRRAAALLYLPFVSLVILNVTMARVGVLPLAVVAMTLLLIQPGAWPFSAGEQVVTAPTESEGDRAAVPTSAGHPSQSC
jgi:hypothetical protein